MQDKKMKQKVKMTYQLRIKNQINLETLDWTTIKIVMVIR